MEQTQEEIKDGNILVVTSPDDYFDTAIRILIVDCDEVQTKTLSDLFLSLNLSEDVVVYHWRWSDSEEWLIDKINKSDLIVYNAESDNQTIVGYLLGLKYAYSIGTRRSLQKINDRAVIDVNILKQLIEKLQ